MKCNAEGRDEYLGIDSLKGGGGCTRMDTLTVKQVGHCLDKGWMDPEDTQNDSPTNMEMFEFCVANPSFVMHGYVVSPARDDVRVSIEGVRSIKRPTAKQKQAFVDMFRCADDFDMDKDGCFAWYD